MTKKEKKVNRTKQPLVHNSVFIADGAQIHGDVEIDEGASIWFNAVIRGDEGKIRIGKFSNIQDCSVIHSDIGIPVMIGNNVSIGHGAVIRGSTIKDNVMVGMNATIMSNSEIGENCIIGANALVTYNKKFPPNSLIKGVPAKVVKKLEGNDIQANKVAIEIYKKLVKQYRSGEF